MRCLPLSVFVVVVALGGIAGCAEDEDPCHTSPCEPAPLELEVLTSAGEPVDTFSGEVRFEGGEVGFACPGEPAADAAFDCLETGVRLFIPIVERVEVTVDAEVGAFAGQVVPQYTSRTYYAAPGEGVGYDQTFWWADATVVLE